MPRLSGLGEGVFRRFVQAPAPRIGRGDLQPDFSPDGKKIAFVSNRDGPLNIYTMRADGTRPVNLTNDPAGDLTPGWQPMKKRR